jgi:SAM-dependent MidA family methyltransferase
VGVQWEGARFRETTRVCGPEIPKPEMPPELLAVLPDGFSTESAPAAEAWWKNAARQLQSGWLLTFDYGLEETEFWVPQRLKGTRRGYRSHRSVDDLVEEPGAADLTAHVHWSGIQRVGERAGLHTELFTHQSTFLTRCLSRTLTDPARFGIWTAPRLRQFQTLTHPQHLGRSFQVLIQSRNVGNAV